MLGYTFTHALKENSLDALFYTYFENRANALALLCNGKFEQTLVCGDTESRIDCLQQNHLNKYLICDLFFEKKHCFVL